MPEDALSHSAAPSLPFDNSYARLPERFFARLAPTRVAAPRLMAFNDALAAEIGLDDDARTRLGGDGALAEIFSGNMPPEGADPLAMAYAGHQFGGWSPQLGDGRALLLGEVIGPDDVRRDIQLKGSGPTPYSRRGDGRAAVGPVLREYLVSEAMAALGVPTTRSLAAVATGEPVYRERPLPGAVLTRVASAHLRVGTFQYFASQGDRDALETLVAYSIERLYPDLAGSERPALALLGAVLERQAALTAQWMAIGFIHGVQNTDNMSIAGETIDYGPCAFMDAFDPATVFSSIDEYGRYSYGNQPAIAHWNLAKLAEALLPLLGDTQELALSAAQEAIDQFPSLHEAKYLKRFRAKLGLGREGDDDSADAALISAWLDLLTRAKADFTLCFRRLSDVAAGRSDAPLRTLIGDEAALEGWLAQWRERLAQDENLEAAPERMRLSNPAIIPRNHQVEAALAAAERGADLTVFERLHRALADPYADHEEFADLAPPPKPDERVLATFCGT